MSWHGEYDVFRKTNLSIRENQVNHPKPVCKKAFLKASYSFDIRRK